MKSRFAIVHAAIGIVVAGAGLLNATTPGTSNNVQLVGQNPLFGRGMNAAAANYKHYLLERHPVRPCSCSLLELRLAIPLSRR